MLNFTASESKPIPAIATDKTNLIIELRSEIAVWTYEKYKRALCVFFYSLTIKSGG